MFDFLKPKPIEFRVEPPVRRVSVQVVCPGRPLETTHFWATSYRIDSYGVLTLLDRKSMSEPEFPAYSYAPGFWNEVGLDGEEATDEG